MLATLSLQDAAAVALYDEYVRNGERENTPVWVDDFVLRVFRGVPRDGALLDVGCGTGRMVAIAETLGFSRYVGVDPSHESIVYCQRAYPEHTFVLDEIRTVGARYPARFDAFFLTAMFMHLPRTDGAQALRSLRAALRPGASGLVATPKGDRPGVDVTYCGMLQTLYTVEELIELWDACGFSIDDAWVGGSMIVAHARAV